MIQEVTSRESFKEIMGEMVLLCNEAMKRSRAGRTASKPLSLEYIADRLDVDDPCFGYVIRSDEGQLQGFITVTTFTNWQKNFKWDSLNEVSFYYDDDGHHGKGHHLGSREDVKRNASPGRRKKASPRTPKKHPRKRVVDEDGSLAKELQKTVRLGDPYNEGIVWPRIAEISLLGALGCGKALLQLVVEQLEFQRASGTANYDFVALQATDNSIPFYESCGFVRVGAVTYDTKDQSPTGSSRSISPAFSTDSTVSESVSSSSSAAAEAVALEPTSPEKSEAIAMPQTIVSSPHFVHEVVSPGQTPNEIAKLFKVSVWDIIFLNKDIYKDLRPTSRLIKGTLLHVPETLPEDDETLNDSGPKSPGSPTKWFVAKENDTPRHIAKKFGLACNTLVAANRRLLPELQANSRLKAGTRLKVSNLDQQDEICQPYCHWSFPDDTAVEGGEPSYMMVYKLDRKTARNPRTVRNSFAVPVTHHSPPRLLFPPPPKTSASATKPVPEEQPSRHIVARGRKPAPVSLKLPKQPPRPVELKKPPPESGKDVYWEHQKEMHPELSKPTPENEKIIKDRWSRLGGYKKERYHDIAAEARKIYDRLEKNYMSEVAQWRRACKRIQEEHQEAEEQKHAEAASKHMADKNSTLYNKVVKIRDDALEGKEFHYWFVLTYIPDLKWCHLAPMYQDGHFGSDRKKAHGRPRYRLVDEKQGKELDISSAYCIPVRSRALKRTVDADKEEWDIQDGPVKLLKEESDTDSMEMFSVTGRPSSTKKRLSKEPKFRARSAIKPITGKIAVGTTMRHSQDPLKRTRSSPLSSSISRKRAHEELSMEETPTPMKERNRRRCMRCVEFGAPYDQAVACLGAKGRFGREACEFHDASGAPRGKLVTMSTPSPGRKPRRCSRCVECGAPDEQASNCPGAKGRFGRSACIFFTASGENVAPHEESGVSGSEDELEHVVEPPRKKRRNISFETEVLVQKDAQVEVVLTPTGNPKFSRRRQ